MKISLKWLNDYLDLQEFFKKPDALSEILTRAGLEVEAVENKAKNFENVVIGLILEKDKHPNADKLSLCRVTTGQGVVHQIVCGAQNHKSGDRVIVALPGAILPGNFAIQKSMIRNVESYGMLCSYKELGLTDTSDGIAILPSDVVVGQTYVDYAGLNDIIFEIKVTPNRADVLSHFGLARELSCLLDQELKVKKLDLSTILSTKSTKEKISLTVEDSINCPRYTGRYIANIKVGPSPLWLKTRLEGLGFKSINNIVDVTNYILHDLGQPLHAFDADQMANGQIRVGTSEKDEKFVILDGTEIVLKGEELSIKNGENKTLCLAGLMGGKFSGVNEGTQNIFLESACFLPHAVRKTSRQHGIDSESGYRFARGVDSELTLMALNQAASLIKQIADGEVYSDEYDVYPQPIAKKPIEISTQVVSLRLGYECKTDLFENWMKRLGCIIKKESETLFKVIPPTFRFDLESDMDLVEEYARLQGYEHIPESLPSFNSKPSAHDATYLNINKSAFIFRSAGFSQAFNYSFISDSESKKFMGSDASSIKSLGLESSSDLVYLKNPLNEDLNVMRSQLIFGLCKNALTNIRYGNEQGRLFEIGKVFYKTSGKITEKTRIACVIWGDKSDLWKSTPRAPLLFSIKEVAEYWLKEFRIKSFQWEQVDVKSLSEVQLPSFIHPYQTAILKTEGRRRGFISSMHPLFLEEEKIRVPMVVAEFEFDDILPQQERALKVSAISRFPIVERDLSLMMDKYQPMSEVFEVIKKITQKHLLDLEIFDIYEGENLAQGQKSVALRLKFQDANATLEDNIVNQYQEQIIIKLRDQLKISLRN